MEIRRLTIVEGICGCSGCNDKEAGGEQRLADHHLHSLSTRSLAFSTSFLSLDFLFQSPAVGLTAPARLCRTLIQVTTSGLHHTLTPLVASQLFTFSHNYIPLVTSPIRTPPLQTFTQTLGSKD